MSITQVAIHMLRIAELAHTIQRQAATQLADGVDLASRDGIEGALWNILTVSLVAAIAAAVLFVLGPRIIALGNSAVSRVQAPPW